VDERNAATSDGVGNDYQPRRTAPGPIRLKIDRQFTDRAIGRP
jgi:hypothetical protein